MSMHDKPIKTQVHGKTDTVKPAVTPTTVPKTAVNVDPKGAPTIDPNLKTKENLNKPVKDLPKTTPTAAPKTQVDPNAKH